MSKLNLPKIDSNTQDVEYLVDSLLMMRKELEYALMHLDEENVPVLNDINSSIGGIKKDVEGNFTSIEQNSEQISLVASDVQGNTTAITQNSEQISLVASDVQGNTTAITQNSEQISLVASDVQDNTAAITVNSDNISLKVSNSEIISAINLSPEAIQIASSRVDITAGDLNITAGDVDFTTGSFTITANHIDLNGVTTMTGLAYLNNNLYLGNGADNSNKISFESASITNEISVLGDDMSFKSSQFDFNGNIIADGLFLGSGNVDCGGLSASGDVFAGDAVKCDRVRVNGSYISYGVQDNDSINFYSSAGALIGGINFSSGVIY